MHKERTHRQPLALSINETAASLGLGRTKVYELINDGQLKTVKVGRRTLVVMASIAAIVERAA